MDFEDFDVFDSEEPGKDEEKTDSGQKSLPPA
jgi:hypothetical protein